MPCLFTLSQVKMPKTDGWLERTVLTSEGLIYNICDLFDGRLQQQTMAAAAATSSGVGSSSSSRGAISQTLFSQVSPLEWRSTKKTQLRCHLYGYDTPLHAGCATVINDGLENKEWGSNRLPKCPDYCVWEALSMTASFFILGVRTVGGAVGWMCGVLVAGRVGGVTREGGGLSKFNR